MKSIDLSKNACYNNNIDMIIKKLDKKYNRIEILNNIKIRIKEKITPNMVVYKGSFLLGSFDGMVELEHVDINLDYTRTKLVSVYVDNYHPNVNKNKKFCTPEKFILEDITVKTVSSIIDSIKVYNLTNCYSVPDKLKDFINKREEQLNSNNYYKMRFSIK